jgi:hypothetical protein
MNFDFQLAVILAVILAAIGTIINLCVFAYEFLIGPTISFLPVVSSLSLTVALILLGAVAWYRATLIGVIHMGVELSAACLTSYQGKEARKERRESRLMK